MNELEFEITCAVMENQRRDFFSLKVRMRATRFVLVKRAAKMMAKLKPGIIRDMVQLNVPGKVSRGNVVR